MDTTGLYFPPKHELNRNSRLLERGELFLFDRNLRNDEILFRLGMVIPFDRRKERVKSCDSCGKSFSGYNNWLLHRINKCIRTSEDQLYYGDEEDYNPEWALAEIGPEGLTS